METASSIARVMMWHFSRITLKYGEKRQDKISLILQSSLRELTKELIAILDVCKSMFSDHKKNQALNLHRLFQCHTREIRVESETIEFFSKIIEIINTLR